jgi:hypothetical protein
MTKLENRVSYQKARLVRGYLKANGELWVSVISNAQASRTTWEQCLFFIH